MKRHLESFLLCAFSFFSIGFVIGSPHVHAKPMQISSPSYPCKFGNGGTSNATKCTQYIVEVNMDRLGCAPGGCTVIYQVQSSPVDPSNLNISTVALGYPGSTSVQAYLPGSSETFTLYTGEP
jgi:hypothetical protein